jgi:predicted phosphate transport protein (TIGR00153 family)
MFGFIPKNNDFFEFFALAANNIERGARVLNDMLGEKGDPGQYMIEIKDIEHEGDKITHDTVKMLNKTFVTPIDREDIHALITGLDDVLDLMDSVASKYVLYKMHSPHVEAKELADILLRCSMETVRALTGLQKFDVSVHHICIELNSLENEADRVVRNAIARLFDNEKDPIEIIKWKEIFETLEDAADKFEDVANIVEGIIVKHG